MLAKKEMVTGLPLLENFDRLCEGCILGKQHTNSFPVGKLRRATQQLEFVHSDLCGPMETKSHGDNQYVLTLH